MSLDNKKLKVGFLSPISGEWFNLHTNKLEMVNDVNFADYLIYESNGDPVHMIQNIKNRYPKEKLVFILSGDQSQHIDNECIWFTNAVKPSGLAKKQTQIFVTNPAIFKFYENVQNGKEVMIPYQERSLDIYFKGTIWEGMRTEMYKEFSNKPHCEIINNNMYWNWRLNSPVKPTQEQLEETAYDSYRGIMNSTLCLCPKGNGNSSMRIIEALACGSIPILINDFSEPFGVAWGSDSNNISDKSMGLAFDTRKHTWKHIYEECKTLIEDVSRYRKMAENGKEYFEDVIYGDAKLYKFKMYNNIDTVCFGFSGLIVDKLFKIHREKIVKNGKK